MKLPLFLAAFAVSQPVLAETGLPKEAGYVLAMETVFGGMSYLSTKDQYYGHWATGALDRYKVLVFSGYWLDTLGP